MKDLLIFLAGIAVAVGLLVTPLRRQAFKALAWAWGGTVEPVLKWLFRR
jgi:hypothetical protein